MNGFNRLIQVIERLRGPEGCPWDQAQTLRSIRGDLIEEAHEAQHAIEHDDRSALASELGDVLFVAGLMANIAGLDMQEIAGHAADKMIARHPHVYGNETPPPRGEWEKRKLAGRTQILEDVPSTLPAGRWAHKVTRKAAAVGFDWTSVDDVRKKVDEELAEMDEAIAAQDQDAIADEFGDVLFSMVNLGRHLGTPAEFALRGATAKFIRRFNAVEALLAHNGTPLGKASMRQMEDAWQRVKENAP